MFACENCPLRGRPVVEGYGPKGKLLILGEAPGYTEVERKKPFVGEAGRLLRQTLRSAGIDPEKDVYYTNAVICHPPENETPSPQMWFSCRERLIREILDVNPTKILAAGAIAYSDLIGSDRALAITKERGIGHNVGLSVNGQPDQIYYVMPTLHPASILRTPDFFRDFAADVEKWLANDKPIPFPKVLTLIPEDRDEAIEMIGDLGLFQASSLSCDLETTGLDPREHRIESIGFGALTNEGSDYDGVAIIIPTWTDFTDRINVAESLKMELLEVFSEWPGEMRFHNIGFDLQFLSRWFGVTIRPKRPLDTMTLNYARDERGEGKFQVHGLKYLSRRYDIADYHFNFDWFYSLPPEERPYDKLFQYQGLDCYVTAKLGEDLMVELYQESPALCKLSRDHLTPAAIAYGEIEDHGALIDVDHFTKLKGELEGDLSGLLAALQARATLFNLHVDPIPFNVDSPDDISKLLDKNVLRREEVLQYYINYREAKALTAQGYYKTTSALTRRRNALLAQASRVGLYREGIIFNPESSSQAPKFLEALGLKFESTEREYLWLAMAQQGWKKGDPRREPVDQLIEYRQKSKILSTFVVGLLNARDKNDRVHPGYLVAGSGTGRPACKEPNLQNIPQVIGPQIRRGFISPPGWIFVSADYSQLELRVVMHLAHDERGIQAYIEGRDIHREVASTMFGKPPEDITFFERYLAKYVDFGLIYGRSSKGLIEGWEMEYLVEQGGERWTLEEADYFIEEFLGQFPGVKQFIEDQHKLVVKQFYIETLMGRRRRFPYISSKNISYVERQSVNSPIQSLASDLCMSAVIRLSRMLPEDGAHILFTVYDSIDLEVREDLLPTVIPMIKREMENTPIKLDVPIKVDIEIGPNWGDLEKAPAELLNA